MRYESHDNDLLGRSIHAEYEKISISILDVADAYIKKTQWQCIEFWD